MPSIFLDPQINNGKVDWDEVESAVLEQTQFAILEWRKANPLHQLHIGEAVNFTMDVKIKDLTGTPRTHNEIALSVKVPGMSIINGGAGLAAAANAPTLTSANPVGSLWGPPIAQPHSPAKANTPPKPTGGLPMPKIQSSAVKCYDCGSPGILGATQIYCSNSKCKHYRP